MSSRRRGPNLVPGTIVAVSGVALLWTRLLPLTQSLWADEIHSIVVYVDPGPAAIFGHYIANDHLLFELLAWASTGLIGDHSEAAYRFWGVAPALAAAGLMTWWLWRRLGPWVAAIFALLALVSPLYYQLSIDARGYGLGFLGTSLMLIGADRFVRTPRNRELAVFAAGAVIGIWSLPVFALSYVGLTGLLVVHARPHARRLLAVTGLVGALSALFYAPVLGDLVSASKQTFGPPLPWHGFISGPFRDLLAPEVLALSRSLSSSTFAALGPGANVPVPGTAGWPLLVAAALVLAGVGVALAARERFLAPALLVPALFTYTVLDLGRLHTVDRFASFLLLPLLVACALALVAFGRWFATAPGGRVGAGVLAGAFSLLLLARTDSQLKLELAVPYENDRAVAELVEGAHVRSVFTNLDGGDVFFYLGQRAISTPSRAQLEALFCSGAGPFVYLQELIESPTASTRCLRARSAVSISIPQRHILGVSAGSPFIAWLAPGSSAATSAAAPTASGGRAVRCRVTTRPVVDSGLQPSASGQPFPVRIPPAGSRSQLVLTVLHVVGVGSIRGAGTAAGETFTAPSGFVALEYSVVNRGAATVIPERSIGRLFGLTGDFGGSVEQVGAFDPACQPAESSFAASHRLADPGAPVTPGQAVETVAIYPLANPSPVTRYVLAWSSLSPRISVALPELSP